MNEKAVHKLLERYFDGTTTLDEERDLKRYFAENGDKLPESLKMYSSLFGFFADERAIQQPIRKKITRRFVLNFSVISGIAASIAILLFISLPKTESENFVHFVNGQRVYDQAVAIAMAESKLQSFAESMQRVQTSVSAFERLQETGQSLQQFDRISEAFQQVMEIGSKIETLNN